GSPRLNPSFVTRRSIATLSLGALLTSRLGTQVTVATPGSAANVTEGPRRTTLSRPQPAFARKFLSQNALPALHFCAEAFSPCLPLSSGGLYSYRYCSLLLWPRKLATLRLPPAPAISTMDARSMSATTRYKPRLRKFPTASPGHRAARP